MVFDAIVIGGGIAGLTVVYELHRRQVPFVLLERCARAGGLVLSEDIDGYTIDAGPDALLVQKPDGIRLCEELGLKDDLSPRRSPGWPTSNAGADCTPYRTHRCSEFPRASDRFLPRACFPGLASFAWPGNSRAAPPRW